MAGSVPGHGDSQISDIDAVFDNRVSTVASWAPFCLPSMIR
jgi:hypothetical protein